MRRAALSLLLLLSCAGPVAPASRTDAILGGAADPAATTSFLLDLRFDSGAASICSAVLISPRVLLTAAHCVDPAYHSASTVTVKATNKADIVGLMQSDMISVTTISRHPSWNPADAESDFDLAALLLATAPAGVTPLSLSRAAPLSGQAVAVLGYGRTSASDGASSGTRRSVTTPITSVATNTFAFGTAGGVGICAGDSGGAALLGSAVAGIHSRTSSTSCGAGVDIRVDRFLSFIDGFVATNDPPPCGADGRCSAGCGTTDPDCRCIADGACDASCGTTDPDCRCIADGACDASCATPDPDCACAADGRCTPACGLSDSDCLDDGMVCTDAAACVGQQCLADARGFSFCSRSCSDTAECQLQMTCQAGVCRAPPAGGGEVKGGCASAPGLAGLLCLLLLGARKSR